MQTTDNVKWVIFTQQETYFSRNIHQVSKIENSLRKQGIPYRTIYYMDNKPVTYEIGKGYQEMSREEELRIINEAERGEQNGTSER
jgi:hypothetical protein